MEKRMRTFESDVLKKWFVSEQRDLPWRNQRTPYAVWVSEMMLQQTQVSVVIPYFLRWMERFPTIKHLAEASLDEVIKMWEGLGYYSRARYLHEGARHILKKHNGVFPHRLEDLEEIKGLGPYTTGAVLSFAYHQRTAAVDGNVIRVLSRYFMIQDDIAKPKVIKSIWKLAEEILPIQEPWVFNEALIELGATVCTRQPNCQKCPLKNSCMSFANGLVHQIPYKSSKVKIESLYRAVAVVRCGDHFLVRRGQKGEIMSDLHEFPYFETDNSGIELPEFATKIRQWLKCDVKMSHPLPEIQHSFTRFRVRLKPIKFICEPSQPAIEAPYMWRTHQELKKLAFSSGHRRIFQELHKYLSL